MPKDAGVLVALAHELWTKDRRPGSCWAIIPGITASAPHLVLKTILDPWLSPVVYIKKHHADTILLNYAHPMHHINWCAAHALYHVLERTRPHLRGATRQASCALAEIFATEAILPEWRVRQAMMRSPNDHQKMAEWLGAPEHIVARRLQELDLW